MTAQRPVILHQRLSRIALALPGAVEIISHGSPGWRIGDKNMFGYFWHNHHDDGMTAVLAKTAGPDEQALLIEADPDLHFIPPYIGHRFWIGMRLDLGEPDWDQVAHRLAESWKLAAPKKLLAAFAG